LSLFFFFSFLDGTVFFILEGTFAQKEVRMAALHLRGSLALVALAGFLSLILYTLPLQAGEIVAKPGEKGAGKDRAAPERNGGVEGIATYYANKYNGRRTASGERYWPDRMTAAHPNLPLGTMVRVINLTNLREVVVRINDRCRSRKFSLIDLSWTAAETLGFLRQGIIRVKMIPLAEETT
jgi:rare lipoprotein A